MDTPRGFSCSYAKVLIPKEGTPRNITQFRPISLCNVVYKLLTKVLVNRLRPFLDRMISPVQGAFVPGRLASDNVVVAQEILHTIRKRKKGGGLALKVDIAKAYDTVNWDFLKETISAFGFPKVLINLIMNYL